MEQATAQTGAQTGVQIRVPAPRDAAPEENDQVDLRRDYGETRVVTAGFLAGRMVIIGWTPRGQDQHVFSMRKANAREQKRYATLLS